ncbi:hypothetical protein M514_03130 [Trichuris suis]|uniref:Uncharacterized protein n=1 Tax=Trichuris suis TaxID=68888 RepID=A0A085MFL0_9BILA|nr:hypothetical protein M513_03130 [Trichuris suis]KFD68238.1 hypothetical protein M514_03130 [Trichuris suis]
MECIVSFNRSKGFICYVLSTYSQVSRHPCLVNRETRKFVHFTANRLMVVFPNGRSYEYHVPPVDDNPFGPARYPFPGRDGTNLAPQFPLSHQFANGLQYGTGGGYYQRGKLNIPLPRWGAIWDLKSLLTAGTNAPWYNYGHFVQPVNPLKLRPSEVMKAMMDPEFREARNKHPLYSRITSVQNLPGDWDPVYCKPPFCNPFVHTMGLGMRYQKSLNLALDGLLDFPIRTGPYGEGIRFPLTGSFYSGPFPPSLFYSHHINPVDPFPIFPMT